MTETPAPLDLAALEGRIDEDCHWSAEEALQLLARARRADELEAFKAYVHKRLDDAGIPTHPDGEHSKAGCRIGDRLDIALAAETRARQMAEQAGLLAEGLSPLSKIEVPTKAHKTEIILTPKYGNRGLTADEIRNARAALAAATVFPRIDSAGVRGAKIVAKEQLYGPAPSGEAQEGK